MKKAVDNYKLLINAIKLTKVDSNIRNNDIKKYNFNLSNFDEKGSIKKERA